VLTLRSAAQGVIDYRQVNLHDVTWWKRWRYLTRTMEEATHEKLLQRKYEFKLALVSNPRISAEDFTKTQQSAQELFEDMTGLARPWLAGETAEQSLTASEEFKAQWLAGTGIDLDNPEAKAEWEASVTKMYAEQGNTAQDAERAAQDAVRTFADKVAAVALKRRSQKGRK